MLEALQSTGVVRASDEETLLGAYVIEVKRDASTDPGVLGEPQTRLTVDVRDGAHFQDLLAWLWSLGLEVEVIKRV